MFFQKKRYKATSINIVPIVNNTILSVDEEMSKYKESTILTTPSNARPNENKIEEILVRLEINGCIAECKFASACKKLVINISCLIIQ